MEQMKTKNESYHKEMKEMQELVKAERELFDSLTPSEKAMADEKIKKRIINKIN